MLDCFFFGPWRHLKINIASDFLKKMHIYGKEVARISTFEREPYA